MEEIFARFQGDPDARQEFLRRLADLRRQVEALDEAEPEDMDSEEYETWGDAHEELEDQIDELMEQLDALG